MRLYAIDANGIAHWLYHAKTVDPNGYEMSLDEATAYWFGQFKERLSPTHVAAFFDGGNNWRCKVWSEYKSSRAAKPIDIAKVAALKNQPRVWSDLGVWTRSYDTFEADDAIASLCNLHASEDCEIVIVSTDKDMMQLVDDHVRQYDPRPDKSGVCRFYDAKAVEEKLGVPPYRVAELLAIWGDSSDDVPGIEGWGKVKAVNAIKQTMSMAEILRKSANCSLNLIGKNHQLKLSSQKESLELWLSITKLRIDVQVPDDVSIFRINERYSGISRNMM